MKCPKCSALETKVVDSRHNKEGSMTRRRRECESCGYRFTTFERIEYSYPQIRKKNGELVVFEPDKVLDGIRKACQKRPVSEEQTEKMLHNIEAKLLQIETKEINTKDLGLIVLSELKNIDSVAYIRFASVYWEFKTLKEFMKVIQELPGNEQLLS